MINTKRKTIPILLMTLCMALLSVFSAPTANASGLLIADGGFGGVLEIKDHDVRVTINNGIAVTHVDQVFVNTEDRIVEALYTFPVPKGASVSNFSMWINGKEMVGEVLEKERARKIYESYKQTRRDPGLLEQVDYKTFEMRIFPIPAGAEQRVQITYYQALDTDHDWSNFVYPLATSTRKNIDQRTTGRFSLNLQAKSEIPFTKIESQSHQSDFVFVKHNDNFFQASLEINKGELSRDVVLGMQAKRPRTGVDFITSKQRGEDGYLQMSFTVGEELSKLDTGMDYVFVLDISGSMSNSGKLGLSRNSISAFVEALGEKDRFELMAFNVAPETLFGKLETVNKQRMDQSVAHLRTLQAKGGTNLRPALEAAYRYADPDRPLNVVVLSDGMTEHSEQRELVSLIQQRPGNTRVFCVGVGNEVNRGLLRQLAEDSGGLAAFISQGDNFQRQADAFRRKLARPAISNVKITFEGKDVYEMTPGKVPNIYFGSPTRLYARYRGDGKARMTIKGEILGSPFTRKVDVNLPASDDTNPEIERMWASNRVNQLMREARTNGSMDSVRSEIVQLCEGYSIVSEFASFIVLENDAEYKRWKIERRNATRIQRDRRAQDAVRKQLDALRSESLARVGPNAQAEPVSLENPQPQNTSTNSQPTPTQRPNDTRPNSNRSWDLNIPSGGGGGGGAIDPLTALTMLGLGGLMLSQRKKRQD